MKILQNKTSVCVCVWKPVAVKKEKKKNKKINPQANKKKYEKCHNFYLWHQKFLIPTPGEKLGAKQGLLPGNFCIFTDLFKLSFLRAAMFIV